MNRDQIKLRFWQDEGELHKIAEAADRWFDLITDYLGWLNHKIDPETAPLELLDLLAWQRDIDRLDGEDEDLYRRRVKYALANAKDAGSKHGFELIWNRLGLGDIEQIERFSLEDWDVIKLRIDEKVFGRYNRLFDTLIEQYGRTCRRYVFESTIHTGFEILAVGYDCEMFYTIAR